MPEKDLVVSYLTLRQMIGWIGFLMPIAVRLLAYAIEGIHSTGSISAYYYTGMRDAFVSTLVLVGALLTCYRTPVWHDNLVATIAGIAAIGIGLFPMDREFAAVILTRFPKTGSPECYINNGLLGYHYFFVFVFFSLAFYLVYFRFRAFTPPIPSQKKRLRNEIYKWCGIAMAAGFLSIGYLDYTKQDQSIFWPETLAVMAFAFAWIVKGQFSYFKDE